MERFAFKIDNSLRANLYKLCRLCGIDHPEKHPIIEPVPPPIDDGDEEPTLRQKVLDCLGIKVTANDQMPQQLCTLCFDRVNDIYEYRLMCTNTQVKTRKLLGLPEAKSAKKRKLEAKNSILGDLEPKPDPDDKKYIPPIIVSKKKTPKTPANGIIPNNYPMVQIASTSNDAPPLNDNDLLVPMATPKPVAVSAKRKRAGAAATPTTSAAAAAAAEFGNKAVLAPVIKLLKVEAPECPSVWCRVCRCGFETKDDLARHMNTDHVPTVHRYGCASCNEIFQTPVALKEHHTWHTKSRTLYQCAACDKRMPKLASMVHHNNHCVTARGAPLELRVADIPCGQCQHSFLTRNLFDWHDCLMRTNGKCPRCGRHFVRKRMLFLHTVKCDGQYSVLGGNESTATESSSPVPQKSTPAAPSPIPVPAAKQMEAPLPQMRMPTIKLRRVVAAVKMEPETMLDIEEDSTMSCNGDDRASSSDEDTAPAPVRRRSMAAQPVVRIKREPQAAVVAARPTPPATAEDSDDDVIFVETEPARAPIVIDDKHLSPPGKKPQPQRKPDGAVKRPAGPLSARRRNAVVVKLEQRDEAEADESEVIDGHALSQSKSQSKRSTPVITAAARIKKEPRPVAVAPIRVKPEPGVEPDEADADEDDVYDGYADEAAEESAPTPPPAEPRVPPLKLRIEPSVVAPIRVKLEPGIEPPDEAEADEDDVIDGYREEATEQRRVSPLLLRIEPPAVASPVVAATVRVKLEPGLEQQQPEQQPDGADADENDDFDGSADKPDERRVSPLLLRRGPSTVAAIPPVRVKLEPGVESEQPDEAEADEDDVYDGYADAADDDDEPRQPPLVFRIKQEPRESVTEPADVVVALPPPPTSDPAPILRQIKLEPGTVRPPTAKVKSSSSSAGSRKPAAPVAQNADRRHARLMAKIRQEMEKRRAQAKHRTMAAATVSSGVRIKTERMSPEPRDEATGSEEDSNQSVDAQQMRDAAMEENVDNPFAVVERQEQPEAADRLTPEPASDKCETTTADQSSHLTANEATPAEMSTESAAIGLETADTTLTTQPETIGAADNVALFQPTADTSDVCMAETVNSEITTTAEAACPDEDAVKVPETETMRDQSETRAADELPGVDAERHTGVENVSTTTCPSSDAVVEVAADSVMELAAGGADTNAAVEQMDTTADTLETVAQVATAEEVADVSVAAENHSSADRLMDTVAEVVAETIADILEATAVSIDTVVDDVVAETIAELCGGNTIAEPTAEQSDNVAHLAASVVADTIKEYSDAVNAEAPAEPANSVAEVDLNLSELLDFHDDIVPSIEPIVPSIEPIQPNEPTIEPIEPIQTSTVPIDPTIEPIDPTIEFATNNRLPDPGFEVLSDLLP